MDEPTDEQMKILRKDIVSGRVMIVEVEHYKKLEDNLSKAYGQIKNLEAENKKMKALKCPPIESGDTCICPIEELQSLLIKKDEQIVGMQAQLDMEGIG